MSGKLHKGQFNSSLMSMGDIYPVDAIDAVIRPGVVVLALQSLELRLVRISLFDRNRAIFKETIDSPGRKEIMNPCSGHHDQGDYTHKRNNI